MRIVFGLFLVLIIAFLFLQGNLQQRNEEKPVFLIEDVIAQNHQTNIKVKVESPYKPTEYQIDNLKADYANIWAHLNHLYETNEVEAGKEYYTEAWFKQICANYEKPIKTNILRTDLIHELHLKNWSSDALVCTAIDSNVVLHYQYPNQQIKKIKTNIAVVLHFQGDHWRIDALKILDEETLNQ